MNVVTTSLEALIQRATNPQNEKPDVAAIEAFCVILTRETEGVNIASKLITARIHSKIEWEALQALALLDTCMKKCGTRFHTEVGKFRFLNEMIKLVSPKYLGNTTPVSVRQKVLELLSGWTVDYPKELKIKEAFEMLKKQGVVPDELINQKSAIGSDCKHGKSKSQIFEDEEKSKLLQKLLQSKNPDDLHMANRLIRTMVKEDEKRVERNSRRVMEVESVHSNAKLLSDILDSYSPGQTNSEELELMNELNDACGRLKPIILRLVDEIQDDEEMLRDVLMANDELDRVSEKYKTIIHNKPEKRVPSINTTNNSSLLDFLSNEVQSSNEISTGSQSVFNEEISVPQQTDMDILGDIFNKLETNSSLFVSNASLLLPDISPITPVNIVSSRRSVESDNRPTKVDSKVKALEELNELGETLLKESLSSSQKISHSNSSKEISRIPMESQKTLSVFQNQVKANPSDDFKELSELSANQLKLKLKNESEMKFNTSSHVSSLFNGIENSEMAKIHSLDDEKEKTSVETENKDVPLISIDEEVEIKSLSDIFVTLETIKPGSMPPLTVINEKNGITVVLHFAKDNPRPDVSVIVVTTMSKNSKPLTNYLFQAVVPKKCKCKLQPPSGKELSAHNPFLPPSAITQIILIANPFKIPVSLKFILSYTMDEETVIEMGQVEKLPGT